MTVMHKQVYRSNAFGGILNTTLCGRLSHAKKDHNTNDEVSCKLCIGITEQPNHWRNKNILNGERS